VEDQSNSPTGAPAGQSQSPLELKKAQRRLKQQQNLQASQLSELRKQWASEHSSMLLKRQQAHQELRKQNQARSLAQEGKRSKDAAKGQIAMKAAQHVVAQRKVCHCHVFVFISLVHVHFFKLALSLHANFFICSNAV
jgi:hypothetical protein